MTDDRVESLARALADDLRSQELRSAENVRAVKFAENLWLETRDLTMVGIDGRIDLHALARVALAWMKAPERSCRTCLARGLQILRHQGEIQELRPDRKAPETITVEARLTVDPYWWSLLDEGETLHVTGGQPWAIGETRTVHSWKGLTPLEVECCAVEPTGFSIRAVKPLP